MNNEPVGWARWQQNTCRGGREQRYKWADERNLSTCIFLTGITPFIAGHKFYQNNVKIICPKDVLASQRLFVKVASLLVDCLCDDHISYHFCCGLSGEDGGWMSLDMVRCDATAKIFNLQRLYNRMNDISTSSLFVLPIYLLLQTTWTNYHLFDPVFFFYRRFIPLNVYIHYEFRPEKDCCIIKT